jgi:hypothetical protein
VLLFAAAARNRRSHRCALVGTRRDSGGGRGRRDAAGKEKTSALQQSGFGAPEVWVGSVSPEASFKKKTWSRLQTTSERKKRRFRQADVREAEKKRCGADVAVVAAKEKTEGKMLLLVWPRPAFS